MSYADKGVSRENPTDLNLGMSGSYLGLHIYYPGR